MRDGSHGPGFRVCKFSFGGNSPQKQNMSEVPTQLESSFSEESPGCSTICGQQDATKNEDLFHNVDPPIVLCKVSALLKTLTAACFKKKLV